MTYLTKKTLIIICSLVLLLGAIYYLYSKNKQISTNAVQQRVQSSISVEVPVHQVGKAETLNIAKRRGLCRTMNTHLVNYSKAQSPEAAKQSITAMTTLTSQMLNYYAFNDSQDDALQHQTLASQAIWVDKRDFRDARQHLLETLHQQDSAINYQAAAQNIKTACEGCHRQFLKPSIP